jgi:hypothetical protein
LGYLTVALQESSIQESYVKKHPGSFGRFIRWLGVETNSRAVTTLLAIGTAFGVALTTIGNVAFNRLVPVLSPALSATDYGEGYRRGRREAELEAKLRDAEARLRVADETVRFVRWQQKVREDFSRMTEEEVNAFLKILEKQ